MIDEKLLSVFEAQAMTGRKASTWRRDITERKVASVKLGRLIRIPLSEVQRLISSGYRASKPTGSAITALLLALLLWAPLPAWAAIVANHLTSVVNGTDTTIREEPGGYGSGSSLMMEEVQNNAAPRGTNSRRGITQGANDDDAKPT